MCESSLYQLFLQAVGLVCLALLICGFIAIISGFNFTLFDDDQNGG